MTGLALAEVTAIDGATVFGAAQVVAIVGAALAVKKWIADVKDDALKGRHALDIRITKAEAQIAGLDSSASGIYRGPAK
jgi:hypothetical protein